MRRHQKKIMGLATKELLLSLFDFATPFFQASRIYRQSVNKYLESRSMDRSEFLTKLRYWQRQGYIDYFVEGKERYAELTLEGVKCLKDTDDEIEIKRPKKWDGKWRVVVFDVPEDCKRKRDVLRSKLRTLGFYRIQMSVYVYPFECSEAIRGISSRLNIRKFVLIMISEIIENEKKIINAFYKKGILERNDLRINKRQRT